MNKQHMIYLVVLVVLVTLLATVMARRRKSASAVFGGGCGCTGGDETDPVADDGLPVDNVDIMDFTVDADASDKQ